MEPQVTFTCCSWDMAVLEAGRPGTDLWSPRVSAAGGRSLQPFRPPPTALYTQSSISHQERRGWSWLGCALAAQGEGRCRDGACGAQGCSEHCLPSPKPSLPGRAGRTVSPEPLPGICIFEARDTDRGFNESKVASRALTDARPRYYF